VDSATGMAKPFEKSLKASRWNPLFLYKLLKDMIYGKAQKMWSSPETIEWLGDRGR
jgi:hypothetical protein